MDNFLNFNDTWDDGDKERINLYYGHFSAKVRQRLLAINVKKPDNIFEILYSQTRTSLLARNKVDTFFNNDLNQTSIGIRNGLLANNVIKSINLEKDNETTRNSLLSKNELLSNSPTIDTYAKNAQNSLLNQNGVTNNFPTIDTYAKNAQNSLLNQNVSSNINIDTYAENAEKSLIAQNVPNKTTIDTYASTAENSLLSQNVPTKTTIDTYASVAEKSLISQNVPNKNTIDTYAKNAENSLVNQNVSSKINIDTYAIAAEKELLSKNVSSNNSIDTYAGAAEKSLTAQNVPNKTTIDTYAITVEKELLSKNVPSTLSIDTYAGIAEKSLLSQNVTSNLSIDAYAGAVEKELLSKNVPSTNSIDTYAGIAEKSLLSQNVTSNLSIDTYAGQTEKSLISQNVSSTLSIDTYAGPAEKSLIAENTPSTLSIDTYAPAAEKSLIAQNVPSTNSIDSFVNEFGARETDSQVLNGLLSQNVPSTNSIDSFINEFGVSETDTQVLNGLLSQNVPSTNSIDNFVNEFGIRETDTQVLNGLLSQNVPSTNSIDNFINEFGVRETDAQALNNLLSQNVPSTNSIDNFINEFGARETDSQALNNLLSQNVSSTNSIDNFVNEFGANETDAQALNSLLSKNTPSNLSIDTYASQAENSLLSQNVPSNLSIDTYAPNAFNDLMVQNAPGLSSVSSVPNDIVNDLVNGAISIAALAGMQLLDDIFGVNTSLQQLYGTTEPSDYVLPGVSLVNKTYGEVTLGALEYNSSLSTFNLSNTPGINFPNGMFDVGTPEGYQILNNILGGSGLLSSNFGNKTQIQIETNSTPAAVVQVNNGQYLSPSGAEGILKPGSQVLEDIPPNATSVIPLGTADSMMSQTDTTDSIAIDFDNSGKQSPSGYRGVKHIINTIKGGNSVLSGNYDPQNTFGYVTSKNGNSTIQSFSKYNIANPYAPEGAGNLEFVFTNYAIEAVNQQNQLWLPPYIKSFNHSSSVNWNSHEFLGRPEAVYTYNNVTREASIDFILLTDYAQSVIIGNTWPDNGPTSTKGQVTQLNQTFDSNFTDESSGGEAALNLQLVSISTQITLYNSKLNTLQLQVNGTTETQQIQTQIAETNTAIQSLQTQQTTVQNQLLSITNQSRKFSESQDESSNIYTSVIQGQNTYETSASGREIISTPDDTIKRLNNMNQSLLFQPAFFSGDRVDFLKRMEFLEKLTRPSSATTSASGFSFLTPPVAHLKLGDYINHDIIVTSINYDFSDSTWSVTEGAGKVVPLFVNVSMSFKLLGFYGGSSVIGSTNGVPLSNTQGGFFQPIITNG